MQELLNILNEVRDFMPKHYTLAVVGGAVRDKLLGRDFKDVDIVAIPLATADVITDVEDLISRYPNDLEVKGFRDNYGGASTELSDFEERLYGVLSIEVLGRKVDILFQRNWYNTIKEIVSEYDHVANMVYLEGTEVKVALDKDTLSKYLSNKGFHTGREIRECRFPKMNAIMQEHGEEVLKYLGVVMEKIIDCEHLAYVLGEWVDTEVVMIRDGESYTINATYNHATKRVELSIGERVA